MTAFSFDVSGDRARLFASVNLGVAALKFPGLPAFGSAAGLARCAAVSDADLKTWAAELDVAVLGDFDRAAVARVVFPALVADVAGRAEWGELMVAGSAGVRRALLTPENLAEFPEGFPVAWFDVFEAVGDADVVGPFLPR